MKFIIEKTEVTRKEVDIIKELEECAEGQEYKLKNESLTGFERVRTHARLEVFQDIIKYLENL